MSERLRINGVPADRLDALDRGLAYGDGLFETMRQTGGHIPLWRRHLERLGAGCQRLQLPLPDDDWLQRECRMACAGLADAVVRLTWTRGSGPRGYASPTVARPTCIVYAAPAAPLRADWYHQGIRVHVCATRLAIQPRLAGIKHLNRLEQVLARSEWQDEAIAEGVVCDSDGRVVGATAANLFAVLDGTLVTPPVDRCGVAGVARAEVLARQPEAAVRALTPRDLDAATEIFLTSSVRGIVPVARVPTWHRDYPVGPLTRALQRQWHAAGIVPEPAP